MVLLKRTMTRQKPMNKNDMLDLALEVIGTPGKSPRAEMARSTFSPKIDISEDRIHESYDSLGMSMMTDRDEEMVISISFYGRKMNRWQGEQYTGNLPKGLAFGMLPAEIHSLLGAPLQRGVNWEKWDFGDYTLRTEHNSKCEGPLRVVTLGLS